MNGHALITFYCLQRICRTLTYEHGWMMPVAYLVIRLDEILANLEFLFITYNAYNISITTNKIPASWERTTGIL